MKLKYKLATGSILLTGAGILMVSQFSYRLIVRTREKELESKGRIMIANFTERYADVIHKQDEEKLLKGLLELKNDSEVLYGMVLDPRGRIIADTNINQVGRTDEEIVSALAHAGSGPLVRDAGKGEVLDVAYAAKARQSGETFFMQGSESNSPQAWSGIVRLGLSKDPMLRFARNIRGGMSALAAAVIVLTFALSSTFALFISRPIAALILGIEEIAKGNLDYTLKIASKDEIGQVGKAFNAMARDLRKAKDDLVQTNAELANRVQDLARTNLELKDTQEKVVRSEKLAAIGKLASGVGHELRNPLGAIRNAVYYIADALKGSPLLKQDPTLLEFLGIVDQEIASASHIIGDLLDFSRVVKLTLQPTDINALLADVKKMLEIPSNVRVTEDYAKDIPPIALDPQRMRQVFANLATNAIQAMPKGGSLRIVTEKTGNPGGHIAVRIQDTGEGIAPDILGKIFEPLFTTKAKGTGLGLPISQGYVQAHGGEITVKSAPGAGTEFTVRLPIG